MEIFREIVFFLMQARKAKVRLGGVLYLHRITDSRVTGSGVHAFSLVKKICGESVARSVALVTTFWDVAHAKVETYREASQRETELTNTEKYWGSMQRLGSQAMRWEGTRASANSILTSLLRASGCGPLLVLQIQREMVDDGKDLDDTESGLEMTRHFGIIWQQLRQRLTLVASQYDEASRNRDTQMAEALEVQRESIKRGVEAAEKAQRDLRDSFKSTYVEKMAMYQKLYLDAQMEEAEMGREIELLKATSELALLPHDGRHTGTRLPQPRVTRIDRLKKRQVLKKNSIPILGMLGGAAVVAAGGATLQIPIVAAGVALFGTAAMKVDLSRSVEKKKRPEEEWEVQEYDA